MKDVSAHRTRTNRITAELAAATAVPAATYAPDSPAGPRRTSEGALGYQALSEAQSDYQLGQRVAYTTHVTRGVDEKKHAERAGTVYFRASTQKHWSTEAWPGKDNDGGEGVIVGKRTLSDGLVLWGNGYDSSTEYKPERHFTAYLVAFDLRRKPVYVLPEHIIGYWGEKS